MSAISGITSNMGGAPVNGGPGEAKSVIEGTLVESAKMASWYKAPMLVPDARQLFQIGGSINLSA